MITEVKPESSEPKADGSNPDPLNRLEAGESSERVRSRSQSTQDRVGLDPIRIRGDSIAETILADRR